MIVASGSSRVRNRKWAGSCGVLDTIAIDVLKPEWSNSGYLLNPGQQKGNEPCGWSEKTRAQLYLFALATRLGAGDD